MQARVSNQQFDTLSLAPISYAAASAVSCLDACAAAAYRLCIGATGRESDLRQLGKATQFGVALRPKLQTWAQDTLADPRYPDMVDVRHRMVHRDIPSTSVVGSAPGRTTYRVGGKHRTPEAATRMFADIAQCYYERIHRRGPRGLPVEASALGVCRKRIGAPWTDPVIHDLPVHRIQDGGEYRLLSGTAAHTCTVLAHESGRVNGEGKYTRPQINSHARRS